VRMVVFEIFGGLDRDTSAAGHQWRSDSGRQSSAPNALRARAARPANLGARPAARIARTAPLAHDALKAPIAMQDSLSRFCVDLRSALVFGHSPVHMLRSSLPSATAYRARAPYEASAQQYRSYSLRATIPSALALYPI
jgi:hypothetical protein